MISISFQCGMHPSSSTPMQAFPCFFFMKKGTKQDCFGERKYTAVYHQMLINQSPQKEPTVHQSSNKLIDRSPQRERRPLLSCWSCRCCRTAPPSCQTDQATSPALSCKHSYARRDVSQLSWKQLFARQCNVSHHYSAHLVSSSRKFSLLIIWVPSESTQLKVWVGRSPNWMIIKLRVLSLLNRLTQLIHNSAKVQRYLTNIFFPHLIKVVDHPEGSEKKSELLHVQLVLHHLEKDHLGPPQTSQNPPSPSRTWLLRQC